MRLVRYNLYKTFDLLQIKQTKSIRHIENCEAKQNI